MKLALHEFQSSASPTEVVLATIAGNQDDHRLLFVHEQNESGESRILLRQQSFADGVGWFTQNTIGLEPQQVAELKMALGAMPSAPLRRPQAKPATDFQATVRFSSLQAHSA